VALCNCCCYSTNQTHGSDGGLRHVWGPLFDKYQVDLVISGHVHAYERTNPIRAGQPTRKVKSGGTVDPVADGTTYICAGGGGNHLYTSWYGSTDAGDAGDPAAPRVWQWNSGETARGGRGKPADVPDPAEGFSAFRRAVYSCLVVDVTPPGPADAQARMHVRALMPAQTPSAVTSIAAPAVMDSVTLARGRGAAPPGAAPSGGPPAWLYGAGGAAVIAAGGAAYIARRRGIRGGAEPGEAGSGPAAGHDPPARGDAADDW
jgi:hypothetical protein